MILTLFALILRPVGFSYRSKLPNARWRNVWDWALFVGAIVPSIVFGVAFGNLLQGVPFSFDEQLRVTYYGSFFGLLNPYGLLAGLVSLSMMLLQGSVFLQLKTEGEIRERARRWVGYSALALCVTFALAGIWLTLGIDGYRIVAFAGTEAASNPTTKQVVREAGAWLANYGANPLLWVIPALVFVGAFVAWKLAATRPGLAFIASSVALGCVVLTAGVAMFPFLMPSSLEPGHSLTMWDSTSSLLTLRWMFWMVIIFLPIVIAYTSWVYRVMRGPVTAEDVREHSASMY